MTAILLLFLVGVLLLAADVFVSSFILAGVGGAAMLAGCVVAHQQFGLVSAVAAGAAALVLLGGALYVELVLLPRTRFGRGLVVHSVQTATSQPPVAAPAAVHGREATALTTLAPSGYVQVDGRRYEAFCQSGLAAKGSALRVVGSDNFRLIVTKS
jgi:membrane-bound ClpP family serine protease